MFRAVHLCPKRSRSCLYKLIEPEVIEALLPILADAPILLVQDVFLPTPLPSSSEDETLNDVDHVPDNSESEEEHLPPLAPAPPQRAQETTLSRAIQRTRETKSRTNFILPKVAVQRIVREIVSLLSPNEAKRIQTSAFTCTTGYFGDFHSTVSC